MPGIVRAHDRTVPIDHLTLILLVGAGLWAGAQNALAGGGAFVTLPVLMAAGLDARTANLTSTVALFPGQVIAGYRGRAMVGDHAVLPIGVLVAISLGGGAIGAWLLLITPSAVFARLVPWLVLFATALFIAGGWRARPSGPPAGMSPVTFGVTQFAIGVYGGYFGGGNGFLMLAALAVAGFTARSAAALKNILIALVNAAAVLVFLLSARAVLDRALVLGVSALIGGVIGVWVLRRIDETLLRVVVAAIGLSLSVWLFAAA